jgi:hypothetical protein
MNAIVSLAPVLRPTEQAAAATLRTTHVELSVVMPCLDEAKTVGLCVRKALAFMRAAGVCGEVVIADNGSVDGSQRLAEEAGARVIRVSLRGYGAALQAGIAAARGEFVIMGDSDDSYDFSRLELFLQALREGDQLVMGNRFRGGISTGAMPRLHRYLGNPVLSGIGRLLFRSPVRDFHCGLRGFRRSSILDLDLKTIGMEFASEMVVKATIRGLQISEVPTTLQPDGRDRKPHLRSWRDGWRHLRFLLLYSPTWLFLNPGLLLLILGVGAQLALFGGDLSIGAVTLGVHTSLYAGAISMVGLQMCLFAIFGKVFAVHRGLLPPSGRLEWLLANYTLERGLILGLIILCLGLGFAIASVGFWIDQGLGALDPHKTMRIAIPAVWLMVSGAELMLGSFFISLLRLGAEMNSPGPLSK